jgi:hypothetical protein
VVSVTIRPLYSGGKATVTSRIIGCADPRAFLGEMVRRNISPSAGNRIPILQAIA